MYDAFTAESHEDAWLQVVEGYVKPYGILHWWLVSLTMASYNCHG